MSSPQVWFITGASSGFGRGVMELVLAEGGIVVGTARKPSMLDDIVARYPPTQLLVLQLDVTRSADVTAAFAQSIATFGRLDIVLNNAGFCVVTEAEGISENNARALFDVNFWGAATVSMEAVKVFRDINRPQGGRLLQMSSRSGIEGTPVAAHYCATKAALEAYTEAFTAELHPIWNIKVTLVEPALFRTSTPWKNVVEPPHPAYADPSLPTTKHRAMLPTIEELFTGDPTKLCEAMLRLSRMPDPPFRLPMHKIALETARRKGHKLIRAADEFESWSENVYLDSSK